MDGTGQKPRDAVAVSGDVRSRALAIWPGLDRRKLTRTCGDPGRVASLVGRRTALPREAILGILGHGNSEHVWLMTPAATQTSSPVAATGQG